MRVSERNTLYNENHLHIAFILDNFNDFMMREMKATKICRGVSLSVDDSYNSKPEIRQMEYIGSDY